MGKPISSCNKIAVDVYVEYEEKPKKIYAKHEMYHEVTCPNGIVVRIWRLNTIQDCYPAGAMLCDKRTPFGNRFRKDSDPFTRYNNWIYRQPKLMQLIRLRLGGKTDLVCGDRCKYRCHVEVIARIANPKI